MRTGRLLIFLMLAAAVVAAGCARKRTVALPGGHATMTEKGGDLTIESETGDGKTTVEVKRKAVTEAELGVPVYPGAAADVSGSYASSTEQSESMKQHMLSTKDDFDKVFAFYKSKLTNVEKTVDQTAGSEKVAVFTLEPKGGAKTSVSITSDKENKVTRIQVITFRKPGK